MTSRRERWGAIDAAVNRAIAGGESGVFRSITGADWGVELRRARGWRNEVSAQIAAAAANLRSESAGEKARGWAATPRPYFFWTCE